jgi:hypothetical protein
MSVFSPPRHIVWSTDHVDLSDPFQRRWYLRQVLLHGRAQDIRALNLTELNEELDELNLPEDLHSLWKRALEANNADR